MVAGLRVFPKRAVGLERVLLLVGLAAVVGCGRKPAPPVSLQSELLRLTQIELLSQTPRGTAGLISTADPTGGNSDWGDWRGVADGDVVTLAELSGPGCVRRIWHTGLPATEWLFFFDGERAPRIAGRDFFGEAEAFKAPLTEAVSGGRASYLPLPYARSLRIAVRARITKPDHRPYYQINYETFPTNTLVESFPAALSEEDRAALTRTREVWQQQDWARRSVARCRSAKPIAISSKQAVTLLRKRGWGTLTELAIQLHPGRAQSLARARRLRELVLEVSYGDAAVPAITVPFGDFFCSAPERRPFVSGPLECQSGDLFLSRFPMPFREGMTVRLWNGGTQAVQVSVAHRVSRRLRRPGSVNYLHAQWRQKTQLDVSPANRDALVPYPILELKGAGHYVGTYLVSYGLDGGWLILEGDETFRLNGEAEPSIKGTGLEDYFNGGWYYQGLYDRPTDGLVDKAAFRTAQYRFHLPDPIPFTNGLEVAIEFGVENASRGYLSSVAYWYQPGPAGTGATIPPAERRHAPTTQLDQLTFMASLMELEQLDLDEVARERCEAASQRFVGSDFGRLCGLRALAYRAERKGFKDVESEVLALLATGSGTDLTREAGLIQWPHAGAGNVVVGTTMNGEGTLYLDGRKLATCGHPFDLSTAALTLSPGAHTLTAETTSLRYRPWLTVGVRGGGMDLATDTSWEATYERPPDWPVAGSNEMAWGETQPHGLPPFMNYWQFSPNAQVRMQQGRRYIQPKQGGWTNGVTAYFRKRFTYDPTARAESGTRDRAEGAEQDQFRSRWDKGAVKE